MSSFTFGAVAADHAAGLEIARHVHDEGQLTISLRGTAMIVSEAGAWLAPPGLAVWVPSGVPHGARYSESSSLVNLLLPLPLASGLPAQCGLAPVSDLLRELAREAVRLHAAGGTDPSLDLLGQLIVAQARQPLSGPLLFVPHGRDRRLRLAIDILSQDPGRNLLLNELAALAHASARTLARLFVAETGMTFSRWREHLRMVHAVDRLVRGCPITQTALELGYQSASSFTTRFTHLLGAPPRRYMQRLHAQSGGQPQRGNATGARAERARTSAAA